MGKDGAPVDFGALCGIGIPIAAYSKIANAIFKLKFDYLGKEYAENEELKGKELLKPWALKQRDKYPDSPQKTIQLVASIIDTLIKYKLVAFGCVCFEQNDMKFACSNEKSLDLTFRYLCERINMYMKREHPGQKAIIVFDNRDSATDEKNARAITNYLVRSRQGKQMRSSVLEIPMFAISQAHNIGLQLADLVTTVTGIYAAGKFDISEIYNKLHRLFYNWKDNYGRSMSTLRWVDPNHRGRAK